MSVQVLVKKNLQFNVGVRGGEMGEQHQHHQRQKRNTLILMYHNCSNSIACSLPFDSWKHRDNAIG